MKIAVVTGASSGIGREFARALTAQGGFEELWVIARRRERLDELSNELGSSSLRVKSIPLDLLEQSSLDSYAQLLADEKPEVVWLVNASGFGYFREFTERPLSDWLRLIDLNDKALVALTYLTLPYMSSGSGIYNIASTSAFQPVPYEAIYGASKAFVLSFSRAINMELRGRGIRVLAVCPHWTKTEFFDTAVVDDTIAYYNYFNRADDVARTALKNMRKGRDVSLCRFPVKWQIFLVKHLPHRTVMKIWCRQQKR